MQKLQDLSSLLALRKAAALIREINSLSEAEDADATTMHAGKSADIKKNSPCGIV